MFGSCETMGTISDSERHVATDIPERAVSLPDTCRREERDGTDRDESRPPLAAGISSMGIVGGRQRGGGAARAVGAEWAAGDVGLTVRAGEW